MITSALISQCRREFNDIAKSTMVQKQGDGTTTLYNVGVFPVIENSYAVKVGTSGQTSSKFSFDLDSGDLLFTVAAPPSTVQVQVKHKYANWRDQNWVEAINQAIEVLNGKGFFRQTVRQPFNISANVRLYSLSANIVDVYEFLESDNGTLSGNMRKPSVNWSFQQDASQLVIGQFPTAKNQGWISYLRNMKTYAATSATLDVRNDWVEPIKKKAGAIYYRFMAAKIASQGNATIDEGHFSFTNLRTQANDLDNDFEKFAKAKKPTRPAKDIMQRLDTGGYGG